MLENVSPTLMALIAAFLIAVARMLYQSALGRIDPNAITVLVNVVSVLAAAAFYQTTEGVQRWPIEGLLWFAAVGVVGSFCGRYLSFVAQRLVGVSRTSIVMQSVLIWSTLLAVVFLGERLTIGILAGATLIMTGGALLVWDKAEVRKKIPISYYGVPLLTAFSFALTFLLRRYGLAEIPSSAVGMGMANGTSVFLMTGVLMVSGGKERKRWNAGGVAITVLGGIFNATSAFCFWMAIQMGEIVQVVPINRLSVLFVILFSWLFFRKEEAVTWQVVLGGVVSLAGAYLIVAGK
jgi:transporter family protein